MNSNEQEVENTNQPGTPVAGLAQAQPTNNEQEGNKVEGAEEKHEVHDHHHSAAYAESVVHSVVQHVHPQSHNLDL